MNSCGGDGARDGQDGARVGQDGAQDDNDPVWKLCCEGSILLCASDGGGFCASFASHAANSGVYCGVPRWPLVLILFVELVSTA